MWNYLIATREGNAILWLFYFLGFITARLMLRWWYKEENGELHSRVWIEIIFGYALSLGSWITAIVVLFVMLVDGMIFKNIRRPPTWM